MLSKEELAKIVGNENVLDDPGILEEYSRDNSLVSSEKPQAVIKPKGTKQIQEVVNWANRTSSPLIPVSSPGGPRYRGDTVPSQGGIIVDLSTMNKILHIDRRDKVAMIEPGVTFSQLEGELRKEGLRAFKPLLPRKTKSALASYLEREPMLIPKYHWDATDPLICIEVVFGTGDVFRTGSSAGPGTIEEQIKAGMQQVNPAGPGLTSLSRVVQGAQGTLGIVTWATVVCGVLPKDQKAFYATSNSLEPLIAVTYELLNRRIGEELFIVNATLLAAILGESPEEIAKLINSLPAWTLVLNLTGYDYFPDERIEYQKSDADNLAAAVHLKLTPTIDGFAGGGLTQALDNGTEAYFKNKYRGNCQDIPFLTTLDRMPELSLYVSQTLEVNEYSPKELGVYIQPTVQGCSCHCELSFMCNALDSEECERTNNIVFKVGEKLAESGAFFSRPYWPFTDIAFRKNQTTVTALGKVKEIFDPNNIMNPGKLCF